MRLTAEKPVCFNGKQYYIGERIPEKDVLNPVREAGRGLISISSDDDKNEISIPIVAKEGNAWLQMSPASVAEAIRIMQIPPAEAAEVVQKCTDIDTVIILEYCALKSVKAAAAKREEELNAIAEGKAQEASKAGEA